MKRIVSILIVVFVLVNENLKAQLTPRMVDYVSSVNGYLEYLPYTYDTTTSNLYPAIIFLHGAGESGSGSPSDLDQLKNNSIPKIINDGINAGDSTIMCFTVNGTNECFIVLAPQQDTTQFGWNRDVIPFIDFALENYQIDPDRVYVTGWSMGGRGTWQGTSSDLNVPNRIAAAAPVSANGQRAWGCTTGEREIPVWAFHGDNDQSGNSLQGHQNIVDEAESCGSGPDPIFTIYPGGNHADGWMNAYRVDNSLHTPNLYEWFLMQTRDNSDTTTNSLPTVSLGADLTITLPQDSVEIMADVNDTDGTISTYTWNQINGPSNPVLVSQDTVLLVSGLMQGVYQFSLEVIDDQGGAASDTINVTVSDTSNVAPAVSLGPDTSLTLPSNSIVLVASATDEDGMISSYSWSQTAGPSGAVLLPDNDSLSVSNLVEGVYDFQVTVTDNDGATASDTVTVTVNPAVTPSGGSWLELTKAGTSGGREITMFYDSTKSGFYTVRDSGNDTLQFYLRNVDSGFDWDRIEVQLRVNFQRRSRIIGDYLDSTSSLEDWTKVSIPLDDFGHDPNRWNTGLSEVTFEVLSSFGSGNFGVDEITFVGGTTPFVWYGDDYEVSGDSLSVTEVSDFFIFERRTSGGFDFNINTAPAVSLGPDTSLTLPSNSIVLVASATDEDGTISSYSWSQTAGPSGAVLLPDNDSLSVSNLVEGVYDFQVTVTDNDGATASDTVTVTVNPAVTPSGGSWLELTKVGTSGGREITMFYDSTKSGFYTVRDTGNDTLQFYLRNVDSGFDWDRIEVQLRVNFQRRTRIIGDYLDSTSSLEDWTKVSIPLDDFGHDPNRWNTGLSEVTFEVLSSFGSGNFGVDEITFVGGTTPFVWYGDDYEVSGDSLSVTEVSDFFIFERRTSGGVQSGSGSGQRRSSELSDEIEKLQSSEFSNPLLDVGDLVTIYDSFGRILYSERIAGVGITLKDFRRSRLQNLNGFYILRADGSNNRFVYKYLNTEQ